MSVRPNQNLYPDGGYIFVEGDGTQFRGDSWKNLVAKVTTYRERNGRRVGNPEEEIFAQYCARMPQHCQQTGRAVPGKGHSLSLNQRVMQFIAGLLERKRRAPIPRVSDSEAAERAAVCANCPRQKSLVQTCQQCLKTVAHGRKEILGGQGHHQGLMACAALGEDLPLSVHIEQPSVAEDRVPAHCWRKARK